MNIRWKDTGLECSICIQIYTLADHKGMSYTDLIALVFNPHTGQSVKVITQCPNTHQAERNNLGAGLLEKKKALQISWIDGTLAAGKVDKNFKIKLGPGKLGAFKRKTVAPA